MNAWSYNINNLTEIPMDKLIHLYKKYEYETPQLEEDSHKYRQGVEALVKIQTELDRRRDQEGG